MESECAVCIYSMKSNEKYIWACGYNMAMKPGEMAEVRTLYCQPRKLPQKPAWCPKPALPDDNILSRETV